MKSGKNTWRGMLALLMSCGVAAAQPVGPDGNLPLPPDEILRRFRHEPFEVTKVKSAGAGVMGGKKLNLLFGDGVSIDAKWKKGAHDGEGWNNSPRREMAAYVVQQFFVDPDDYLVPPTAARCVPLETHRPIDDDAEPTFDGTRCVFGMLAAWLHNVEEPEHAYDAKRFSTDHRYAYHVAHLNLLTYLINHRDARDGNFLISTARDNPQVFAIDNGIAFGGVLYNFFTFHLDRLVVSGLPKQSIERLRRVKNEDWQKLAVVEQLQADGAGILRPVPFTAPLDPDDGARWRAGTLQLGLSTEEIEEVTRRARDLLVEIDQGHPPLF